MRLKLVTDKRSVQFNTAASVHVRAKSETVIGNRCIDKQHAAQCWRTYQQEEQDGKREEESLERPVDAQCLQATSTRQLSAPC